MANTLSERGYYDAAVDLYDEVIERYPTNWKAVNNLGCTYLTMGRFNEAEATLRRGIEIKPNEPRQYISLSVVLQELNRREEAERAARYALSLDANGYGFHYQLGDLLEAQGLYAEALDAYQQEVARHPNFTQARERAVALQSRMGSPSNAGAVKP